LIISLNESVSEPVSETVVSGSTTGTIGSTTGTIGSTTGTAITWETFFWIDLDIVLL
jgi:hypothetical protein